MNWNGSQLKQMAKKALQGSYWKSVLAAFLLSLSTTYFTSSRAAAHEEEISEYSSSLLHYLPAILGFVFVGGCVVLALRFLVLRPLEVGCRKFFMEDLYYPAELDNLKTGFAVNYWNVVWSMFCVDLFIFLWSLLFIIPGIVKSYEYRMIPYLLAENPNMTREEAFERSKRMMDGEKMNAFMLDLSFIGWALLSVITLEIVGIFYYQPYYALTQAALYHALREKTEGYDDGGYGNPGGYGQGGYNSGSSYGSYNMNGSYENRGGYDPNGGYGNQGGYDPNGGYGNQGGYENRGGYDPNGGYGNRGGYDPNGGYGNRGGYDPNGGYGNQGGYDPNGGHENQSGYSPNGRYDHQGGGMNTGSYGEQDTRTGQTENSASGIDFQTEKSNPWAEDGRAGNPWEED